MRTDEAVTIQCDDSVTTGSGQVRMCVVVPNAQHRNIKAKSLSLNHALYVHGRWSAIVRTTRNRHHVVVDTASGDHMMWPRHARIDIIDL